MKGLIFSLLLCSILLGQDYIQDQNIYRPYQIPVYTKEDTTSQRLVMKNTYYDINIILWWYGDKLVKATMIMAPTKAYVEEVTRLSDKALNAGIAKGYANGLHDGAKKGESNDFIILGVGLSIGILAGFLIAGK